MLVVLLIVVLGGLATALVSMTGSGYLEQRASRDETRAFYVAEAGLNEAFAVLRANGTDALAPYADELQYGTGTFLVEVTDGVDDPVLGFDRLRLLSRGTEGRSSARIQMITRRIPNGQFLHGVFGDEGVTIESNAFVDSYNSSNGLYDPNAANDGGYGSIGSNQDITVEANVVIHGDVTPGPNGILDDNAPQTDIWGSTAPAEFPVDMPPINVPAIAMAGSKTISGTTTLAAGPYHFSSLTVNSGGTLTIQGPSTLVLDSAVLTSNAKLIIDATNGPVVMYATGDFDLRSNSAVHTIGQRARDVAIYMTADTSDPRVTVALNSNSDFYGTIYAPNAELAVESNFRVFGAIKARDVTLDSNAQVHFDEDLLFDDFDNAEFERVSWRIVSEQQGF